MKKQYFNIDLERETVQFIGKCDSWEDAFTVLEQMDHGFEWVLDRECVETLLAEGCRVLEDYPNE